MRITHAAIALVLGTSLALPLPAYAHSPEENEDGAGEEELSEEEAAKLEEAKGLYAQAEKLAKKKKWKEAADLYEQAYYLVPGKHGFAFKVAMAAHEAGNCDKALEYSLHFFTYSDPEKHADMREEARLILVDMLEQGCVEEDQLGYLHLTPKQRDERAFELYEKAEQLAAAEEWTEAAKTYEQAYYLVPSKVGFAHKVGMAAYHTEDCDMAHQYLVHFVDYADPAKYADKMAEATSIIRELEDSGCVTEEEMESHQLENPFEITHDDHRSDKKQRGGGNKTMLIAGAALAGVGVAGIGVGVVGFVLAGASQSKLDDLASTDTASGWSAGDYACRDVPNDQCPPKLEKQITNRQLLGGLGVGIGAAALLGGGALIALYFLRGGEDEGKSARLEGLSPMWLPGGGGAAASVRF